MPARLVTENDTSLLESWITSEDSHSHGPEYYTRAPQGVVSAIYSDEEGPLCVVRFEPCLRLQMDFDKTANPERIQKILQSELPGIETEARNRNFQQLLFESVARPLIAFCRRRLGFKPSPNEYIKVL
jgi:hypothetical protein